jgi:hypothetical protein
MHLMYNAEHPEGTTYALDGTTHTLLRDCPICVYGTALPCEKPPDLWVCGDCYNGFLSDKQGVLRVIPWARAFHLWRKARSESTLT